MDSGRSPERIVVGHLSDQVDLRLRGLWPTRDGFALPSPIHSEAMSMPPDDGFGLNDQQRAFPGIEDIRQNAEEEPIRGPESRLGRCARQYFQLLSQIHDLELELNSEFEESETKR